MARTIVHQNKKNYFMLSQTIQHALPWVVQVLFLLSKIDKFRYLI